MTTLISPFRVFIHITHKSMGEIYPFTLTPWPQSVMHTRTGVRPGPWFNIKMSSYQYRKSHCGDKTILRPSYLHNGIFYTGKKISLYWIRPQTSSRIQATLSLSLSLIMTLTFTLIYISLPHAYSLVEWGVGSPWWAWIPLTNIGPPQVTSIFGVDCRGTPTHPPRIQQACLTNIHSSIVIQILDPFILKHSYFLDYSIHVAHFMCHIINIWAGKIYGFSLFHEITWTYTKTIVPIMHSIQYGAHFTFFFFF